MKKIFIKNILSACLIAMSLVGIADAYAKGGGGRGGGSSFSSSRSYSSSSSSSSSRFSSSAKSSTSKPTTSRYRETVDNYNSKTAAPAYKPSTPVKTTTYTNVTPSKPVTNSKPVTSSTSSSTTTSTTYSNNSSNLGTVVAAGAVGVAAGAVTTAAIADIDDSNAEAIAEAERLRIERLALEQLILEKKAMAQAEADAAKQKILAEEEWKKMTPEQRVSETIKTLWVSPCKEWMCLNK